MPILLSLFVTFAYSTALVVISPDTFTEGKNELSSRIRDRRREAKRSPLPG